MHEFEKYLIMQLDSLKASRVKSAMIYSLSAKAKRIRPRLLFATLQGYNKEKKLGYACASALEMIHTYSLIHDDLPAMDNDTLRRGKKTCHIAFDEATAILAGDALLTQAFLLLTRASKDPQCNLDLIDLCAEFAGGNGMIMGQNMDLETQYITKSDQHYLNEMHLLKTGKLITVSLLMGAVLANHKSDINGLIEIGKSIGLLFQIQDDILDEVSNSETLGKDTFSDQTNKKTTYMSIMDISSAEKVIADQYKKASDLLQKIFIDPKPMQLILDNIKNRMN